MKHPTTLVSRWVEFDAGHRVLSHGGACRRPHGHRYRVTITCEGPVPDSGMIVDFGVLAEALDVVHDRYDHRFLVAVGDEALADALHAVDPTCVVEVPEHPTAENIAAWVAEDIALILDALEPTINLVEVAVRETPKSVATWRAP
jgi:6-pyruvoyltetrahydropterin/6-carboxytetrahydropterin synthase